MCIPASLQCRRILARSRASAFDQASAILDSNSEEAWGETKMRPRAGVGEVNMAANSNMAANLRPLALKKTPALQAIFPQFRLTSFHVSFLSRVKINSITWSAANLCVFIAQLVEQLKC